MLLRIAEWLVWLHVRQECRNRFGRDMLQEYWAKARRASSSCVRTISGDVVEMLVYQKEEARILDARLARRYDPSLALSEAVERAKARKLDQRGHKIEIRPGERVRVSTQLTPNQENALEMQKSMAKRTVRDA
jgi:hypothetical protein